MIILIIGLSLWKSMSILSIFLVPFIIYFNAFCCSKIIRRFIPRINSYLAFALGFLMLFAMLAIATIPIMVINVDYELFAYYLLTYQLFLILIYLLNWRHFFTTYYINIKTLLLFVFGVIVFLGIWAIAWNWKASSVDSIDYNLLLKDYFAGTDNIWTPNTLFDRYLFNAINKVLINSFHVTDVKIYMNYTATLIYSIFSSAILIGTFFDKSRINKLDVLYFIAMIVFFGSVPYFFGVSPILNNIWIMMLLITLLKVHNIDQTKMKQSEVVVLVNMVTLAAFAISPDALIVLVVCNFLMCSLSYINKRNKATDYNITMLFTSFLILVMSINSINYVVGITLILVVIVLYIIYFLIRNTSLIYRATTNVDKQLMHYIKPIMYSISAIVLAISFIIFATIDNYKFDQNSWVLSELKGMSLDQSNFFYWVVNAGFWIANILLLYIGLYWERFGTERKFIKYAPITITNFLIFWNPFSTNLFDKIVLSSNAGSIQSLFLLSSVPIVISLMNQINARDHLNYKFAIICLMGMVALTVILYINYS